MTDLQNKKKVGITGQSGFLGSYLYNSLKLCPNKYEIIDFSKDFFVDQTSLNHFVGQCDVIVHLAALNRHPDPSEIYKVNIELVNKLIDALKNTKSEALVIMSSSTQEENDNLYGKSKKEGRHLFEKWAENSKGKFAGLIIPNVFGPFGKPNYNSVIATFCYKLSHNEIPKIDNDGNLKLIYVGQLVAEIIKVIDANISSKLNITPTHQCQLSTILKLLKNYKTQYFDQGIIPELNSEFELNLFNSFRCYFDHETHYPVLFKENTDNRGTFVEVIRLNQGGQVSYSTTHQGITRGNHFHTRKIERFSVIKGKALIQLRKIGTDKVLDFVLDESNPGYVDMPIWYTHNIKNIGESELLTIFWINEFYNPNDPDTYFENV